MTRYIFITGGVVSSLGKGISAAALSALLEMRGYKVRIRKIDPYLNIDPGTMSPYQHGEVFVTDDGGETDLDLGHYERFTGRPASVKDNITTGRIYRNVIDRERRGEYLGATVQIIPHVTDEIKKFITLDNKDYDFIICEIGGTVGDIEAMPFLEAIRQLHNEISNNYVIYVHLTLLPFIYTSGELKTKPTQHSVKELQSIGIFPDILLLRSDRNIPVSAIKKLSLFCNVRYSSIIPALDVKSIYDIPESYHNSGLDCEVLSRFGISYSKSINMNRWKNISYRIHNAKEDINIGIVGKYIQFKDAYKSLIEALIHGGLENKVNIKFKWINAEYLNKSNLKLYLTNIHGILVPGAFGIRGSEGKILSIYYARKNKIPFFGICFGMQMACIEVARNILGIKNASSTEFGPTNSPIVSLMKEWIKDMKSEKRNEGCNIGGTMRIGSYPAYLKKNSLIFKIYKKTKILERHRHRYEINILYKEKLESTGIVFSGMSANKLLSEVIEYKYHPWFIGVQYHPELKSRPFNPHPLFSSFISAAKKYKNF